MTKEIHHMTGRIIYALGITSLLYSLTVNAQAPTEASMLANACAACHGTNGSSQGPATPSIAGISPDYFIDAMEAFKEDDRPATVMNRIAKGYSEEQIETMSKFFSSQTLIPTTQKTNTSLVEKGDALHTTHCEKCHEDGGRASDDDAGILASQKMPYLRYTISDILTGKREIPTKMLLKLRKIHKHMGQDGIEQLLHFYAAQK
jgi:cytochrome subunit of sulfide dehydrogenase